MYPVIRGGGGRHVILLGNPAQLPAVSRRDIFGTHLWQKFAIIVLREVKCATDTQLTSILSKVRLGICDKEVLDVLHTRLQSRDVASVDLDKIYVQLLQSAVKLMHCAWRDYTTMLLVMKPMILITMVITSVRQTMRDCSIIKDRLPDTLVLKVGARVVLHKNIDIDSDWVNGALAVVTALTDNCTVVHKLTNSAHQYPVPRFRQRIEIREALYSIMHQQFPIQLAYGITVHHAQGCTVQKAIVCLNTKFLKAVRHIWL